GGLSISAMGTSILATDEGIVRRIRIEPGMRLRIGGLDVWIEAPGEPSASEAGGATHARTASTERSGARSSTAVAAVVAVVGGLVVALLLLRRPAELASAAKTEAAPAS